MTDLNTSERNLISDNHPKGKMQIQCRRPLRHCTIRDKDNVIVGDCQFVPSQLERSHCDCSGDVVKRKHTSQERRSRSISRKLQNNVDSANVFETLKFAKLIGNKTLLTKAQMYLIKHFEAVLKANPDNFDKLDQLDLEDILTFLGDDQLCVTSEEIVWEAALHWIKFKKDYRKYKVNELLMKIRTGLMDSNYFATNVKENEFVKENISCLPIIKLTDKYFKKMKISTEFSFSPNFATPRTGPIRHEVLFTFGGISEDENLDDSLIIEYLDSKTSTWRKYDVQEGQRAYHGTVAIGYEVFVIGGCSCDAETGLDHLNSCKTFNALQKTWRDLAPLNCHRGFISVALLDEKYIFAIGGVGKCKHVLNSVEYYDPQYDSWTLVSPMEIKRAQACAAGLKGKLYVMGGWNESQWLDSVEVYDPDADQWTRISSMLQIRAGASCVAYHNCIFIIGGYNGDEVAKSGEKYDPSSKAWVRIPPMLEALSEFSATVFKDKIVCVGGEKREDDVYFLTDDVQGYDDSTNQWCKMPQMGVPRHALTSCVVEFPCLDFCFSTSFL